MCSHCGVAHESGIASLSLLWERFGHNEKPREASEGFHRSGACRSRIRLPPGHRECVENGALRLEFFRGAVALHGLRGRGMRWSGGTPREDAKRTAGSPADALIVDDEANGGTENLARDAVVLRLMAVGRAHSMGG